MKKMANAGNAGGVAVGGAYQVSFGDLPDNTRYQEFNLKSISTGQPDYRVDMRGVMNKALVESKALTSTAGGPAPTPASGLVPIYVDPRIIDETRKYTPLVEIFPRVTNLGRTADFNNITAKAAAQALPEDAALSDQDTTYARTSVDVKYLYSVGRVTGVSVAATPSYLLAAFQPSGGDRGGFTDQNATNSKQLEILTRTRALRELEENLLINGNDTTSFLPGNPNGSEYDGIVNIMGATNTVAKGATALTLDDIDDAIKLAFDDSGRPNMGIADSGSYTDLLKLLNAKIGFLQSTQQVMWGFSTIVLHTLVGDVPVVASQFLSNSGGSKSIYFLDMTVWEVRVLQDITYEDLAKTNDSEKFMLKEYITLICRNPSFNASITAIA